MANGDSEVSRLVDQLEREHGGEPWHGQPLAGILSGLTHQQAAARPLPGGHTIWEIVLHLTAWKNEVRNRLGGAPAGEPDEGDWPVPPSSPGPDEWRDALAALDEAHHALVSVIARMPDSQLFDRTNDPRVDAESADTYFQLVEGILQHDIYHSGQIALLKKAVGRSP
jgi:uncharacterized damage-inducible protein DinB